MCLRFTFYMLILSFVITNALVVLLNVMYAEQVGKVLRILLMAYTLT